MVCSPTAPVPSCVVAQFCSNHKPLDVLIFAGTLSLGTKVINRFGCWVVQLFVLFARCFWSRGYGQARPATDGQRRILRRTDNRCNRQTNGATDGQLVLATVLQLN